MKNIDSFFLSGGGINCICLLGVLKKLINKNIIKGNLSNFKNIICCSASSIIILPLLLNFTIDATIKIFKDIDYEKLINYETFDINNLFENYGLFTNDFIEKPCKKFLDLKKIKQNITLKELYELININLVIKTVNISNNKIVYISHETHPDIELLKAIKMTTCIPILFKPIFYDNNYYIDGGLSGNFPIDYNKTLKSKNYLGVHIKVKADGKINNILDFIYHIYTTPMSPYDYLYKKSKVITINVSKTGIIFDNKQKIENILLGYNETEKFLNDYK